MNDEESKAKNKVPPFTISTDSPYYLHPFDGPGASITSVLFNGNNLSFGEKQFEPLRMPKIN